MHNYFRFPKTLDTGLIAQERALLPSIFAEQASSTFLGIFNTIIMGFVSTAALAGVGQINSLNTVVFMFFNSLAAGGTVMVAQKVGKGDSNGARDNFVQALVSGGLFSIFVTLVLFFFRAPLINALFGGAESLVLSSANSYFTMTVFATPLWFLYYQISGAMRGSGDTKTPMRATVVMNVANAVFSIFFCIILKMGAAGAGLSLVLSVLCGAALCVVRIMRSDYPLRLPSIKAFRPDFTVLKEIYSVGIPVALENLMFHGGRLLVQVFIATMGTSMISAYQIAESICQIFQMPLMAYNMLIIPIIGQRAGAGGKAIVRRTLDYYNKKTTTLSLIVGLCFLTLTYPVIWVFTRDTEVIHIVYGMMVIYGLFMPFFSGSFNTPSGFRGARDTRFSLIVATTTMWVVRVFGSYLLGVVLGLNCYGVYLAMCIDWVVRATAYMWWFKGDKWLKYVD